MTRALVFDSGVGGLTIADALRKAVPDWVVDYAADSGFFSLWREDATTSCASVCRACAPRWLRSQSPMCW